MDTHYHPEHWGIKPILFHLGDIGIPAYSFFVLLGLLAGILVYYYEAKQKKALSENGFFIAFGGIAGGIIGAKILQWLIDFSDIISHLSSFSVLFSGRTIVGGLIGGMIGTMMTKKILKIKEKRGNLFAPAIALGVAIGRIGCFLQGCCYGKATSLPWGVDFGDGILRHPTQIYESLFMLIAFFYLQTIKNKAEIKPGQLFKGLMVSYFIFRFLIEFIRTEKMAFFNLTVFQIISICAIIFLLKENWLNLLFNFKKYGRRTVRK